MIRFISAHQIVRMHDDLLDRWGGEAGGGHRGAALEGVEAAVQAVRNSYYETVEELAAAYAVYIVQGHVFMDGNKRSGAVAMLMFLEVNGIKTRLTSREVQKAMIELQARAEAGSRTEDLVRWLANKIAR